MLKHSLDRDGVNERLNVHGPAHRSGDAIEYRRDAARGRRIAQRELEVRRE